MRDYAQVCPQFWLGKTGKKLRGDAEAQLVALYLITSPHANMIGVFHCPIMYIAHETGLSMEGASKGLRRVVEEGFCSFDDELELVWVHEMARFQIGDQLSPKDNRVKSTDREFQKIPECHIRQAFYRKYKDAFHLLSDEVPSKGVQSPFEAPSKPRTGTGTGTGNNPSSPSASESADDGFASFWEQYPKKVAKPQAVKAWTKIKPRGHVLADLMTGLDQQKASGDWQKDGGKFIPHPATWLNGRRWEDEMEGGPRGRNAVHADDSIFAGAL